MGNWVGAITAASTSVIADLGAFGVLPGQSSSAGGHATTQISIDPNTGAVSRISTSQQSDQSQFASSAGIAIAALLVVVGIYMLFWKE